jgi:hypothetical protein
MPTIPRQAAVMVAVALMTCGLGGCGTINGYLTSGVGDYVPQWLGGLPPDAPPRPGTPKYDEYMRERERRRLEPAPAKDQAAKSATNGPEAESSPASSTSSLDAVH